MRRIDAPLHPTVLGTKGIAFYAAIAVAFFASAYSNLFFLLLAFLTLLSLLNVWWTARNFRDVDAEVLEIEPAPAGAGQTMSVRFHAPGRTRFQIELRMELDGHPRVWAQADVVDGETVASGRLPPMQRGLYAVSRAYVTSSYPFGLVRRRKDIPAPQEIIVFPEPAGLPKARTGSEALAEVLGHQASAVGQLQPSALREFRDGDELRSVHWKATARRGELVVKEWEGGSGQGLEVVLDRRCSPEQLEGALALISALVSLAKENKELLTIHSQGHSGTYGKSHRPWRGALRFLAGADVLPPDAAGPPPVSPTVTRLPLQVAGGR